MCDFLFFVCLLSQPYVLKIHPSRCMGFWPIMSAAGEFSMTDSHQFIYFLAQVTTRSLLSLHCNKLAAEVILNPGPGAWADTSLGIAMPSSKCVVNGTRNSLPTLRLAALACGPWAGYEARRALQVLHVAASLRSGCFRWVISDDYRSSSISSNVCLGFRWFLHM